MGKAFLWILGIAGIGAAAAASAEVLYPWINNKSSSPVAVYRDGALVCTMAPGESCRMDPSGVAEGATLDFAFGDGVARTIVFSRKHIHLCPEAGGGLSNCYGESIQ